MSQALSISDTGLRLIKAFEGYRPVDRELVTGARVVGYGHRLQTATPRAMSRSEAEETLRLELRAYEDLINDEVHAPLSQSQFDALCSLAFNIGPKAFRGSDTLRALNNGRVLDAANGFDIWRKSTIDGKTYVVDALMRRRTAEKSLFLRTERSLRAPTAALPPQRDPAAGTPTDDGLPVFTEDMSAGVIAKAPHDARPNPLRRREDQPGGILTLSEIVEAESEDVARTQPPAFDARLEATETAPTDLDAALSLELEADGKTAGDVLDTRLEDVTLDSDDTTDGEPRISLIREAADALGDRLGALLDDSDDDVSAADDDTAGDPDWPQSLIRPAGETAEDDVGPSNLVAFPGAPTTSQTGMPQNRETTPSEAGNVAGSGTDTDTPATLVIDDLAADDVMRASRAAEGPVFVATEADPIRPVTGLWIPILLGFALLGASVAALWLGASDLLGDWGPLMAMAGAIVGALMIVFSLYMVTAGALGDDED